MISFNGSPKTQLVLLNGIGWFYLLSRLTDLHFKDLKNTVEMKSGVRFNAPHRDIILKNAALPNRKRGRVFIEATAKQLGG